MRILAIETSCDDTSIALVEIRRGRTARATPDIKVLQNIVSSQTAIHSHWGGVVPNLAKREHLKNLPKIFANLKPSPYNLAPDLIAVTVGPGLEPALWTGIEFAKKIARQLRIPLVGINHLEGHIYSILLAPRQASAVSNDLMTNDLMTKDLMTHGLAINDSTTNNFPAIILLVSGGHTMLLLAKSWRRFKKLGETRDDAVGEAFDKVARMMELPYPGGPEIEKLARDGNPAAINFPRPMIQFKSHDFSFSGLKTSVLYYLRDSALKPKPLPPKAPACRTGRDPCLPDRQASPKEKPIPYNLLADVAASFQAAAIETLVIKTRRAVEEFGARSIWLSGGVAANQALRAALAESAKTLGVNFLAPPLEYANDNAAMIALAAYFGQSRRRSPLPLVANGNLSV